MIPVNTDNEGKRMVRTYKCGKCGEIGHNSRSCDKGGTPSDELIIDKCEVIERMLLAKNTQYGDSALNPVRIFSKSDATEQIKVRIDDKINRLILGDDTLEKDEDVIMDLAGYFILLLISLDGKI
jgi:hypothetical protein